MARRSWAWGWVGAPALIAACGGDPFVLGDASPAGATHEGGSREGSGDAPTFTSNVLCANQICGSNEICCTSFSSPNSSNCTRGSCGGCNTELACASDTNCTGAQGVCCIRSVTDACATGHNIATCSIGCPSSATRLCDPNAPSCSNGRSCSTAYLDLLAVGLPANVGYGVCK